MLGQHHMIMFTNFIFIFSFTIGCARTTKEIGLVKHTRQKKIFIQIGYSRTLRIHWYLLIFHRRYLIQQQISHYFGIPTFSPTLLKRCKHRSTSRIVVTFTFRYHKIAQNYNNTISLSIKYHTKGGHNTLSGPLWASSFSLNGRYALLGYIIFEERDIRCWSQGRAC